jgi:hypothetical protein
MKSRHNRYDGAVARNLGNAERQATSAEGNPYKGVDLRSAKLRLGIRKDDDQFDTRVGALVLAGKKAGAK